MRDTALAWCAAFPRDSAAPTLAAGASVAIVFVPTPAPASVNARVVGVRAAPCPAAFGQPRWDDYDAFDLALVDSVAPDQRNVALAVASAAAWIRGADGGVRADLDGDGVLEEARRCSADEGEHLTIWTVGRDGTRRRRAHEYYDWGGFTNPTCGPGEKGEET